MTEEVVVVGNGMVSHRFVRDLVANRNGDGAGITVIGAESLHAYDRVALSSWFDGRETSDLLLDGASELCEAGVTYRLGTLVSQIDPSAKAVMLESGESVGYDALVLATGSRPFVPPIPGHDRPGCFVYRTIEDLEQIKEWGTGKSKGVVIGGGLLGLEAANALVNLGLDTSVVEMADRLMSVQLDAPASEMLGRWIDDLGIETHLGFATSEIVGRGNGDDGVAALHGSNGVINADIVVFSAGIRPCDELARDAGLEVGARGGVVVDDTLQTSAADVYAIGEVACHGGSTYGLVGPGYAMASALADQLSGGSEVFEGADLSTKLKLLGVEVASFGQHPVGDQVVFADATQKTYRSVSVEDGKVVGGVLVGDASRYDLFHAMALGTMPTSDLEALITPESSSETSVKLELPDSAVLCSCNNVTRGEVKEAVCAGEHSVGGLKACTNAGTGCGGCLPGVKSLLDDTLLSQGIEVDRSLCEHFAHSRQELFDMVRMRKLTTWSEILAEFGTGLGCEICRPAVASIPGLA